MWGVLGMCVECMWDVCKVRMGCVWGGCGEDVSSGMDVGWPVDFSQVLGKTPTERSSSRVLQCTYLFDRLASFIKYHIFSRFSRMVRFASFFHKASLILHPIIVKILRKLD